MGTGMKALGSRLGSPLQEGLKPLTLPSLFLPLNTCPEKEWPNQGWHGKPRSREAAAKEERRARLLLLLLLKETTPGWLLEKAPHKPPPGKDEDCLILGLTLSEEGARNALGTATRDHSSAVGLPGQPETRPPDPSCLLFQDRGRPSEPGVQDLPCLRALCSHTQLRLGSRLNSWLLAALKS